MGLVRVSDALRGRVTGRIRLYRDFGSRCVMRELPVGSVLARIRAPRRVQRSTTPENVVVWVDLYVMTLTKYR